MSATLLAPARRAAQTPLVNVAAFTRRRAKSSLPLPPAEPHLGLGTARQAIAGLLAIGLIAAGAIGWTATDRPQPPSVEIVG